MNIKLFKKHPIKVLEYRDCTEYIFEQGIRYLTFKTLKQAKRQRYKYIKKRYL